MEDKKDTTTSEIKVEVKVETPVTHSDKNEQKPIEKVETKVIQTESKQSHINVISSGKKSQELESILSDLKLNDKNQPEVIKVNTKVTSFGNRIKINNLLASDAEKWIGKTVIVGGWIRTIRVQGGGSFCFVELNDGSSVKGLQIIVDKSITEFEFLTNQSIGACVSFKGSIVKSPGKGQLVTFI